MSGYRLKIVQLAIILITGGAGALVAWFFGIPLPYLLGSLISTAAFSLVYFARTSERIWFPLSLRKSFTAVIGVMIGSTFTSDILAKAPDLAVTLGAMVLFVALAHGTNYAVFRHIGRYDRATAFFSAMPGGLIEAVILGERAGGDVEKMGVQHFVRIILVIISVPTLFFIFTGQAVGSAGGETLELSPAGWRDWLLIAVLVPVGVFAGEKLRLPAGHLVGPMVLTAGLQAFNIIDLYGPAALLNIAQLVVGAGLGTMFARSTPSQLAAAAGLGIISVAITLGMSAVFALVLSGWLAMPFAVLLISFAPGGVTEMSLVALSLGVSPVLVTAHHLFRILFTVFVAGVVGRKIG
ncbi:AbrB family transcriptional regulator [Sulfitobacter sp. F26169L]|uniref:AbrB family transcriptional regulator n=1 Tax=Sulfitobacter sp. F26169L TaxID=2996015 RepID=UPI002260D161|nr:AbrB family transcriptional regulator [Sulfitobacter sp. F26169L]MCX7567390.1 AbrB family transcriptional regulator [Sulfitobacter sp. F26169L]